MAIVYEMPALVFRLDEEDKHISNVIKIKIYPANYVAFDDGRKMIFESENKSDIHRINKLQKFAQSDFNMGLYDLELISQWENEYVKCSVMSIDKKMENIQKDGLLKLRIKYLFDGNKRQRLEIKHLVEEHIKLLIKKEKNIQDIRNSYLTSLREKIISYELEKTEKSEEIRNVKRKI